MEQKKELNAIEALKIVDEVCASVTLNRQGHAVVLQALEVLKKIVEEKNAGSKT